MTRNPSFLGNNFNWFCVKKAQLKSIGGSPVLAESEFLDLVDQIKKRNDGAMCRLVQVYGPIMERIAAKLIGQVLQAQLDPADVVQNVQVTLWVGIRSGRFGVATPERFLALAKLLLRRHIARYWRKVKLEMTSTIDGRIIDTLADQELSAELQEAEEKQTLEVDEVLEQFLRQVDTIDQQLIKMRFRGYSTADAARALKLDPGFLRVRLGRLRQRFANLWRQLAPVD